VARADSNRRRDVPGRKLRVAPCRLWQKPTRVTSTQQAIRPVIANYLAGRRGPFLRMSRSSFSRSRSCSSSSFSITMPHDAR
jgi:hypothetical protein